MKPLLGIQFPDWLSAVSRPGPRRARCMWGGCIMRETEAIDGVDRGEGRARTSSAMGSASGQRGAGERRTTRTRNEAGRGRGQEGEGEKPARKWINLPQRRMMDRAKESPPPGPSSSMPRSSSLNNLRRNFSSSCSFLFRSFCFADYSRPILRSLPPPPKSHSSLKLPSFSECEDHSKLWFRRPCSREEVADPLRRSSGTDG